MIVLKKLIKIMVLLLTMSVYAAPCTASSFQDGEEVKDMSFTSMANPEGKEIIQVSFADGEDKKGTLIIFATQQKDEELKLSDLEDVVKDGSIVGESASGAIIVENYDGSPYEFPTSDFEGNGDIYAILLGANKVFMGATEYSTDNGYFSLGEEREIITRVDGESPIFPVDDAIFFQCTDALGLGYKVFVNFPGEPKEGILLAFAENEGESGKELHLFKGEGWFEGDSKIRCVEDYQGGENNIYSFPLEDLGEKDGKLCVVLIDKNEETSITTMKYSLNNQGYFEGMITYPSRM